MEVDVITHQKKSHEPTSPDSVTTLGCGAAPKHDILGQSLLDSLEDQRHAMQSHRSTESESGGDDQSIIHEHAAWVRMSGKTRRAADLPERFCRICRTPSPWYSALRCGHAFCNDCYARNIVFHIREEGPASCFACCPAPSCNELITPELVNSLLTHQRSAFDIEEPVSLDRWRFQTAWNQAFGSFYDEDYF